MLQGVTPTILGAMPYEGIKFGTVGILERLFPEERLQHSGEKTKSSSVLRKICFGGIGGVMAGLITYPNDTVRRMMQLQGSRGTKESFSGYWDCVRKVYATHGIQRFYRGCLINIVRMAPNTAVQVRSKIKKLFLMFLCILFIFKVRHLMSLSFQSVQKKIVVWNI
mmetsp:Transcript_13847/g.19826  ORF Transcript_13847/g.19826 Transcript_13847/m.19826 type:complete len:166 (-) Transcript_13847:1075-1572(-)